MSVKETIKKSFIKYTLILIGIVIILFVAFMTYYTKVILEQENINTNKLILNNIEKQYNTYYQKIDELSKNDLIIGSLEDRVEEYRVYEILYGFVNDQKIKSIFYITDSLGNVTITNSLKNTLSYQNPTENSQIFRSMKSRPSMVISDLNFVQYENKRRSVYSFGKAVTKGKEVIGYIMFNLMEDDLNDMIFNDVVNIVVVSDRFDNVIVTANNFIVGPIGKFSPERKSDTLVLIKNTPYFINESLTENSAVKVSTLTTLSFQRQLQVFGVIFITILGCAMLLLIIYLSNKISEKNTKAIDKLIYAVNQFKKGNFDYYVDIRTNDEFEILGDQLNNMVTETKNLLKKNSDLIDRKRIAEIKQLEAQFNPHFIFNVMEVLKCTILIEPENAVQMVISLANLLRYSINYEDPFVPLKKDIEYIKDYLRLQKMRYRENLRYSINIEKKAMYCVLPKLIILPVVENCIKHGYCNKTDLYISIKGCIINGYLELDITDDGDGIDENKLKVLNNLLSSEADTLSNIGIYNTHQTLKLLYGGDYGIRIDSVVGKGAKVTIKLPVRRKGEA